jgi:hypothetical protein
MAHAAGRCGTQQARYVVWRDAQPQNKGGRGNKTDRDDATGLPEGDPGKDAIFRWRKRLCSKDKAKKT